jgi:Raf kinase inhibitor-like YbhB/YbcL family protein
MDDPDAPGSEPFVHWLLADLSPKATISEGVTSGVVGRNSAGEAKYFGPHPPSGTHHYHFRVFALDQLLKLPSGFSRSQLEQEMKGHVLAETKLVGTYTAR